MQLCYGMVSGTGGSGPALTFLPTLALFPSIDEASCFTPLPAPALHCTAPALHCPCPALPLGSRWFLPSFHSTKPSASAGQIWGGHQGLSSACGR